MSSVKKNKPSKPIREHSANPKQNAAVLKPRMIDRLPKISPYIVAFLAFWLFASVVYGDVFYMAEQNSLFALDGTVMYVVLQKPFGYFVALSRGFLVTFHYPILGGALLALLLSFISWLTSYVLGLKGIWKMLSFVPTFGILIYDVSKGVNLYYQAEPGVVFLIPLFFLAISSLCGLVKRMWTKKPFPGILSIKNEESGGLWMQVLIIVVLWSGTVGYANAFRQNTILSSKMQRQLQDQDIEGMIETAKSARQPSRIIAAYYAIALSQANLLNENLFDITYDYPDEKILNFEKDKDIGTEIYMADCNFYSGLINSSYHASMERTVVDGPSVVRLKRMAMCAIMNDEKELARKYFHILKKVPFTSEFVETYEPMIVNRKLILSSQELYPVTEVIPISNNFEQNFMPPIFLGYNIVLDKGKSMKALSNSLAACLYAKKLPNVIERTQPLVGGPLPKSVEEAVMIYGMKEPSVLSQFQFGPMSNERLQQFMIEAQNNKNNKREAAKNMRKKGFEGYYPLYYYFENLPEDIPSKEKDKEKKGGVN